jgi:hypothetical protein
MCPKPNAKSPNATSLPFSNPLATTGVRGEKGGGQVQRLLPVDSAVFLASDGRYGAWRWGRPWISGWLGSLGPRFSRLCPDGGGEAVASLPSWNKSFWPRPVLAALAPVPVRGL